MKIRIGYVSQNLTNNITPSHTITVSNLNKIQTKEKKIQRLVEIGKTNLKNTLDILKWNVEQGIYVYRLSSKLIPLATFEGFKWDYLTLLKEDFKKVGDFIRQNKIRVSAHPDHFSVMNTPNKDIFRNTIRDLEYHVDFLTAMGLDQRYKLVVHVGGVYGDKSYGKANFVDNFYQLPQRIQNRITLENDDKSYTLQDVIEIYNIINIPIVLDVHHFDVNHQGKELEVSQVEQVFNTWNQEYFPPKIHFSTPRNETQKRAHAEYINPKDFKKFVKLVTPLQRDFDVMLEAKAKDLAVIKLRTNL